MGKNGAALRAAKMKSTIYSFTREQLLAHDKKIREEFVEEYKRRADEYINEEWERRRQTFATGVPNDDFQVLLSYMLAIPVKVLAEQFGWKPCPKDRAPGRNKMARFGDAVIAEIEGICSNDNRDIMDYCREVYDKYGMKFEYGEVTENENVKAD